MTRTRSYDIIVAGLGGQGVNTVTRVIFELCEAAGRPCSGALFKGGAQKAGTIHAEVRIWSAGEDLASCSNRILPGSLDLMLGFEPHEAMRFAHTFGDHTHVILNDVPVPFHAERSGVRPPDPVLALTRSFSNVVARNFMEAGRIEYGDTRMANFLMLREAAASERFPFSRGEVEGAISRWRATLPSRAAR